MANIHDMEILDWGKQFKSGALHVVCIAAGGLTICDCAASTIGGMNQEAEVWPLTKQVNRKGETGTFWPKLPLTVVPQLEWENRHEPQDIHIFLRRCFEDVAKANRDYVKLSTMYVDLNPCGADYDFQAGRLIAIEVLKNEPSLQDVYFAPELT